MKSLSLALPVAVPILRTYRNPPKGYDDFVEKHGTIFQSRMAATIGKSQGMNPRYLVLSDGGIRATLLYFRKPFKVFGIPIPVYKYFVQGGPVCEREEDYPLMVFVLASQMGGLVQSIFVDTRYQGFNDAFEELGFTAIPKKYFTLDMTGTLDEIYGRLNRLIRKNLRHDKGITIEEIKDMDSLRAYHTLMQKTAQRGGIKVQPFNELEAMFKCYPSHTYLARLDGVPVSGMMALVWKDTAYYYSTGSDEKYFGCNAQDFLLWHAIQNLKKEGVSQLNLMDASNVKGIFQFKKHWSGAEPLTYYHYLLDSPLIHWLRSFHSPEQTFWDAWNNDLIQRPDFKLASGVGGPAEHWEYEDNLQKEAIKKVLPELGTLLEVGCGNGRMALWFKGLGLEVCGVDISPVAIENTNTLLSSSDFVLFDGQHLPYPDDSFDVVNFTAVLLPIVAQGLIKQITDEALRVCKKGGTVIFTDLFHYANSSDKYRKSISEEELENLMAAKLIRKESLPTNPPKAMLAFQKT